MLVFCQVQRELDAERGRSQRALIEHEAKLVALRRGRDELEKVLKSHQVHMQMERQARQDLHLKTLKVRVTVIQTGHHHHHHSCRSTSHMSNRALPMPGTADGDAVSHCQVLGRAGSVHHGADQ